MNNINIDIELKKANDLRVEGQNNEADIIYQKVLNDLNADLGQINIDLDLAVVDIETEKTKDHKLSFDQLNSQIVNLGKLLDNKDFDKFNFEAKKIHNQAKDNPTYNYILAMYKSSVGLFAEAIPLFIHSLKKNPSVFECIYNLGKSYHNLKQYDLAINKYQLALEKKPRDISVLFDLSSAFYLNKDLVHASETLEIIIKEEPDNYSALCDLGLINNQLQNSELGNAYLLNAINVDKNNPIAFNNIGASYLDQNKFKEAITFFKKAQKADKNFVYSYINLGSAYAFIDDHSKALKNFYKVIDLDPNIIEAYSNIAGVLNKQKEFDKAEEFCKKALRINPDDVNTLCNLGTSLIEQKKYKEAEKVLEKSIKLDPKHIKSIYNYGIALTNINKFFKAKKAYMKAIDIQSLIPDNLCDQAMMCNDLKKSEEAIIFCDKAINISPNFVTALYCKGLALLELNEPYKAKLCFEKNIKIRPNHYPSLNGMGVALTDLFENKKAMKYFKRAAEQDDVNFAEVMNNIGFGHFSEGNFIQAKKSFLRAITIDNEFTPSNLNYANLSLLSEDFQTGWKYYEWRLHKKELHRLHSLEIDVHEKRWHHGINLKNKKILVRSEQGLGDTIQFCKYTKLLKQIGAEVIIEVQNSLVELVKTLDKNIKVVDRDTKYADYDFQVPLLSLPLEFKTNERNFPSNLPYLQPSEDKIKLWKNKLSKKSFKVGIAWQGSKSKVDTGRSFSLKYFENISKINEIELISLQKNYGSEQLKEFSNIKIIDLGKNFDNGCQAFLDTAAVMKNLDLVITSDTSIAHLAGSLGCKTWVLLKLLPDWRWFLQKQTSPWYKNIKLFRQTELNNWKTVFSNVEEDLYKLLKNKK